MWRREAIEFGKDLALQFDIFGNGFDHQVGGGERFGEVGRSVESSVAFD